MMPGSQLRSNNPKTKADQFMVRFDIKDFEDYR